MGRPVLSTARIRLEPMTSKYLPLLAELDGDAEMLRYEPLPGADQGDVVYSITREGWAGRTSSPRPGP
jgi:hypothetical protein